MSPTGTVNGQSRSVAPPFSDPSYVTVQSARSASPIDEPFESLNSMDVKVIFAWLGLTMYWSPGPRARVAIGGPSAREETGASSRDAPVEVPPWMKVTEPLTLPGPQPSPNTPKETPAANAINLMPGL